MKMNLMLGATLAIASAVLGCRETTSSEFVRTGGIAALIDVTADAADHSQVRVELAVGGPNGTLVDLNKGDKLIASVGTETKDLQSVSNGVYEGTFATGKEVEFTVNFDRVEDKDAPDSKGTLPPPFDLTKPVATDKLSRASDALVITWDQVPNAEGTIDVSGDCIFSYTTTVSGSAGTMTVPKGTIKNLDDKKPETCTVEVDVSFKREGVIDPNFDQDGWFNTFQERKVSFTSDP